MTRKTTILEADDFANDWYGWVTNQLGHIALGVFLVFVAALVGFLHVGEMPQKVAIYALILTGYVCFELGVQGWRGWDTIEDTVFTAGYGAGAILAGFTEIEAGQPHLAVNILGVAPFFAISALHLFAGAMYRRQG